MTGSSPSREAARTGSRRARFAALALAVAGLAACGGPVGDPRAPEPGDAVVARVAGRPVFASDVRRAAVADGTLTEGEPLAVGSDLFHRTLDEVVDQTLLAREGERLGLERDPLIRRKVQAARDRIVGDALVERRVDRAVNEAAIRSLYEEQQKLAPHADEIRARQILVADSGAADEVRRLAATGANFETLAMQRSTDAATRFNGGDLGWFALDAMPEGYSQVLRTARPGEVVGPIKADGGYVVLKVEERRPEKPIALDEARPQIIRFLTYDEIRTLLARLRKQTRVDVLVAGAPQPVEPASAPKVPAPPPSAAPSAPKLKATR